MKSRVGAGMLLFQVVVQDFKHRQPPPASVANSDQIFKRFHNIEDYIPERTLFKWAKDGRRATDWGAKFGSVISCCKVDSHIRKLEMIEHLRLEQRPIEVEIGIEEITLGRDLEIKPAERTKKIDVERA